MQGISSLSLLKLAVALLSDTILDGIGDYFPQMTRVTIP